MGNFSKVLRILIAIHFGIGAIALLFVLPNLGGMTGTERTLTIIGFILVVVIFVYNLVCLIKDENIILETISNGGSGDFWSNVGRFFLAIPKGIWWAICGIGFLISWPFVKIHSLVKNGSKNGKKEKNAKQKQSRENKTAKREFEKKQQSKEAKINLIKSQYYAKYGKQMSQQEAEKRYEFDERMRLEKERKERRQQEKEKCKQQADEKAEQEKKEQQKQQKKDIKEYIESIRKQLEDAEKKQKEELKQEKQEIQQKKDALIEELKKQSNKLEEKLTAEEKAAAKKLQKDIFWDMKDYITSVSLADAHSKVAIEFFESVDNLRKYIVTFWHTAGVFDVQAAKMFDMKTRKFIGSERFSYVNTDFSQNTDEETIKRKAILSQFVSDAEEKGAQDTKVKNDNYNYIKRILETKAYNFSENDKKAFDELYAKFKYCDEKLHYSNDKFVTIDNLEPYTEASKNINKFATEVRKKVLSTVRDKYNETLKSTNKDTTKYALIEACTKLGYDPKEIAKIMGVEYLDGDKE